MVELVEKDLTGCVHTPYGVQITLTKDGWAWHCSKCGEVSIIDGDFGFRRIVKGEIQEIEIGEGFIFKVVVRDEDMQDL